MAEHQPLRALGLLEGAVEEVREELIFNTDILLAAGVGPWEIHHDAEGLYLSDQWQAVFGIDISTDLLRDYLDLFEPDGRAAFLEQIEQTFRHGVHATLEFRHKLAGKAVLSRGRVVKPGRMVGADLLL